MWGTPARSHTSAHTQSEEIIAIKSREQMGHDFLPEIFRIQEHFEGGGKLYVLFW